MSKLTSKERSEIPSNKFAIPGKRKYPLENPAHARDALARVSEFGSIKEKHEVREKVHDLYPGMTMAPHISKITRK